MLCRQSVARSVGEDGRDEVLTGGRYYDKRKNIMKETTKKRYERIRQAAAHMYGTMPVMQLYACLAADFELSEERVRKILSKKQKNRPP